MIPHGRPGTGASTACTTATSCPEDVDYVCMPLFHANALLLSCTTAIVAGTSVVLDERFSASRFWERVQQPSA